LFQDLIKQLAAAADACTTLEPEQEAASKQQQVQASSGCSVLQSKSCPCFLSSSTSMARSKAFVLTHSFLPQSASMEAWSISSSVNPVFLALLDDPCWRTQKLACCWSQSCDGPHEFPHTPRRGRGSFPRMSGPKRSVDHM
jgi:hypothetical protein